MANREKTPSDILKTLEDLRHRLEHIERDLDRVEDACPSGSDTVSNITDENDTVERSDVNADWPAITEAALEATGVILLVIDIKGRVIHFNHGAERLTGFAAAEIAGRSIWGNIVPKEEVARVKLAFAELQAGQQRNRHESTILSRNGKRHHVTWSNAAIPDANGIVQYIVISGLEITGRAEREQAIRSVGERYRRLIESSPDIIWEYDIVGLEAAAARLRRGETTLERICNPRRPEIELHARFISPAVVQLLGFTPEEMLARSLKQHFTPQCFEQCYQLLAIQLRQELAGVRTDPLVTELEEYRKDGSVALTRAKVQFTRDALGFPTGLAGLSTDITREKQAEQALQESLQQYRMLVESSPTAIAVHCRGVLVYANPETVRLLRAQSLEQVVGLDVLDLVHPDSREDVKKRMSSVLEDQVIAPAREETLVRLDGSAFRAEVVGIPIVYDGEPAIQVVVADIGERKRIENENRQIGEIRARLDLLSPRENEVLRLVVSGKPNKSVASQLQISIKTVEHHRSNLMKKMRAGSIADLVRMTMLAGWS